MLRSEVKGSLSFLYFVEWHNAILVIRHLKSTYNYLLEKYHVCSADTFYILSITISSRLQDVFRFLTVMCLPKYAPYIMYQSINTCNTLRYPIYDVLFEILIVLDLRYFKITIWYTCMYISDFIIWLRVTNKHY